MLLDLFSVEYAPPATAPARQYYGNGGHDNAQTCYTFLGGALIIEWGPMVYGNLPPPPLPPVFQPGSKGDKHRHEMWKADPLFEDETNYHDIALLLLMH